MFEGLPEDTTYAELLEFLKRDLQLDGSTDILPGTLTFDQHNVKAFAPASAYRAGAYTSVANNWNPGYWDTVVYDPGGNMKLNGGQYVYLVPVTGLYVYATNFGPAANGRILIGLGSSNTGGAYVGELQRLFDTWAAGTAFAEAFGAGMKYLTAGTYVTTGIYTVVASVLSTGSLYMNFSICRIA